jgi:UDP-N-acetylmuramyl pentapeptide phosphotransferase/UDP-N-acetylglucosamine-1-phosphate transferase
MIGAIGGFLLWNFPLAQIFLGDGGAYFIGFVMAELLILLIVRHPQVSAWYVVVAIYPIFETLFSIYRRRFVRGRSAGLPDGIHLHTLIYRRVARGRNRFANVRQRTLKNSRASVYLWALSLLSIVPATFFWRSPYALCGAAIAFIVAYVWLYASIVRFKTPYWLTLSRAKTISDAHADNQQPASEQLNER